MESIVTLSGNLPVVSSTAIAEGVGREHKSVIQLVRQNLSDFEEFGPLTFEMRVGKPLPQGGFAYRTEIALLNEQQATLLLTYMRNNEVVRAFKKRLVRAFYEMAKRVRQEADSTRRVLPFQQKNLEKDVRAIVAHRPHARAWTRAFWERCRKECGFSAGELIPSHMLEKAWLLRDEFELLVKRIEAIEKQFEPAATRLFSGRVDASGDFARIDDEIQERLADAKYGTPNPKLKAMGFQLDLFAPAWVYE